MIDDAINQIVQDFEARVGRRMSATEYLNMRQLRQSFKSRLDQIGPTEGSAMFEEAKQTIVNEAIAKLKKFFDDIVNPEDRNRGPILIQNPGGEFVIGEPAPRPAPVPPRWGFPVDGDIRGPRFPVIGRPIDTIQPIRPPTRPTVPQIPQVGGPQVPMFPETRPRL